MHTDKHETAWHVIQNPYPAWREAKAILICPACAGMRKEASQDPRRREHSTTIDLSRLKKPTSTIVESEWEYRGSLNLRAIKCNSAG